MPKKHDLEATPERGKIGFWACWSLTVGIMIGSGVFLLPSVLAPYGLLSFGGWLLTAGGSILLSLVFARLARRTKRSGGVFVFTRDAFGDLPGFLIAWGYWTCYWIANPAIAMAFVGYLAVFVPSLENNLSLQATASSIIMWLCIIINMRGLKEATFFQLIMAILKLIPLLLIIGLGFFVGTTDNFPEANPQGLSIWQSLAATALLTMWAFSGMEAGTVPAGDVKNPEKTVPRAIVLGTITVAFVYIASTAAVMSLVPAEVLVKSTSPFAEAARALGAWGPSLIAIGAMISTAGALNGTTFVAGQIPMAVALDGLGPKFFAKRNSGGSPTTSLLIVGVLTSILLIANFSKGLIDAFTFLIMVSTLAFMLPLIVCSLAEFIYSLKGEAKPEKGWAAIAMAAFLYSIFAALGSGLEVVAWGVGFILLGIPVYYLTREKES